MNVNDNKQTATDPNVSSRTKNAEAGESGEPSRFPAPSTLPTPNAAFDSSIPSAPVLSLPKGGGAIRGMGEKFDMNLCTGTASASIPIRVSPARNDFQPQLGLTYNSASGNGSFGLGWKLSLAEITRKTSKGIPRYADNGSDADADVFLVGGQDDLVPRFKRDAQGEVFLDANKQPVIDESVTNGYIVRRYSPRVEKSFDRIERWKNVQDAQDIHWRITTGNNITSIYGKTWESRISDPGDVSGTPNRIFSWLISESYDAKGDAMVFIYKPEDATNFAMNSANELNRSNGSRTTNRYVRQIRYGNTTPNRDPTTWEPFSAFDLPDSTWKFSIVFDYGEYDDKNPKPDNKGLWECRSDPFSTYLSGFEVRTYRLCSRILMFHHFSELGIVDYLVSSVDIVYDHNPSTTYLKTASQVGYILGVTKQEYTKQTLPPLEFEYTLFPDDSQLEKLEIQSLGPDSMENLPTGVDGSSFQWIDIDQEGIPGILTDQGGKWYFKRNTSANKASLAPSDDEDSVTIDAKLEPAVELSERPYLSTTGGTAHFGDVLGAGKLDLVQMDNNCWGYFERTEEGDWLSLQTFREFPNIDPNEVGVKMVDLTGDGLADILICKDQIFFWYPCLGAEGYGPPEAVTQSNSPDSGPVCIHADAEQTIYLADMSGDGLQDIVRIRNGDICYWPSLAYGKFGSAIQMDEAPLFDTLQNFSQKYIRLMDIDGSGTTDVLYFGSHGFDIYRNQSGNSFAERKRINQFPQSNNMTSITTVDLLGNGTTCIVLSSLVSLAASPSMSFIDICNGKKPHLLTKITNNLGAETSITYASSTKFYVQDRENGNPWITKLAFPVHCVESVTHIDRINGTKFNTYNSYHHGYYDGFEREFCGFARVEQWNTDHLPLGELSDRGEAQKTWDVPMSHSVSWYHTGYYNNNQNITAQLSKEYFTKSLESWISLDPTCLPAGLDDAQLREASRALKGQLLRSEIYGRKDSPRSEVPYRIQESNSTLVPLQSVQDSHGHSIFMSQFRESISAELSVGSADSRVSHSIALETDEFGNVLKSLQIQYGRSVNISTLAEPHKTRQETSLLIYSEYGFTNAVDDATGYLLPLPCETQQYEITKLSSGRTPKYLFDNLVANSLSIILALPIIPFDGQVSTTAAQRRLIKRSRVLYRSDDLSNLLPLGKLESLKLPGMAYDMSFTTAMLNSKYQSKSSTGTTTALIPQLSKDMPEAGYINIDGDGNWWKPSRSVFFSSGTLDTPAAELTAARSNFFSPHRAYSAFKNVSFITYDAYFMFPASTTDAVGNVKNAIMDYRTLQISISTDENKNRTMATFDPMGLVVGTAVMGKEQEKLGDSLENFNAPISQDQIDQWFADPSTTNAIDLLGSATTRVIYDYARYYGSTKKVQPSYTATISREQHASDLTNPSQLKVQISFAYTDGSGRVAQTKTFVGAGPLKDEGPQVDNRWITREWNIANSQGKAVRSYQTFFNDSHQYKFNLDASPSTISLFDSLGQLVGVLNPDHTFSKGIIEPWKQTSFDANDTIQIPNPREDNDIGYLLGGLTDDYYLPSWYDTRISGSLGLDEKAAAVKATAYANTPQIHHFDPVGRAILTVDDNGNNEFFTTSVELDVKGAQIKKTDALGRICIIYDYSMCGDRIHESCMSSGEKWMLNDVAGQSQYSWNNRGFRFRSVYDAQRRPTEQWMSENGNAEILTEQHIYGESSPDAQEHNLCGKKWKVRDQVGLLETQYDFKGNSVASTRRLAKEYKKTLDLSANPELETETFTNSGVFDALNRAITKTANDGSVTYQAFDQQGFNDKVYLNIKGENTNPDPTTWQTVVANTVYNAQGQTTSLTNGNGVVTTTTFDPLTTRIRRLLRRRGNDTVQDLAYTWDPTGNITSIRDGAQQTLFFRNSRVDPSCEYTYDATYRLIAATGREHVGQTGGAAPGPTDAPNINGDSPNVDSAMARYEETYKFDAVGNILEVGHKGGTAANPGWTRRYAYNELSLLNGAQKNDRLSSTSVGSSTENYQYDSYGNMTFMPQLSSMIWDSKNQLQASSKQRTSGDNVPETTYYIYNSQGERIRKVTESQATSPASPRRIKERIYLADFEIFRTFSSNQNISLERTTLHVNHGNGVIADVELRTKGTDNGVDQTVRYQFSNYLGSVSLELDETARLVSYEEYFPYGSTSYSAAASNREVPKRYRYSGKEKDDENGLYFYGARYYAAWLGRWTAPDPSGDSALLYVFVKNNPIAYIDPDGREDKTPRWKWGVLGTFGHDVAELYIKARIDMLRDPSLRVETEMPTEPGGTKSKNPDNKDEKGAMDTVIGVIPPTAPSTIDAHIYELRMFTRDEAKIEAKYQETVHYSKNFPAVWQDRTVANKGPGTILDTIVAQHPGILDPIKFRIGNREFTMKFYFHKQESGSNKPGVILYTINSRRCRDDECEEEEEAISESQFESIVQQEIYMENQLARMQVNLQSTVGSQAINSQRMLSTSIVGLTLGGGIVVTIGGVLVVFASPELLAGAGTAAVVEGATATSGAVATEAATAGGGAQVLPFVARAAPQATSVLAKAAAFLFFWRKSEK